MKLSKLFRATPALVALLSFGALSIPPAMSEVLTLAKHSNTFQAVKPLLIAENASDAKFNATSNSGSVSGAASDSGKSSSNSGKIHRVPDGECANRSDFFKLWNNTTIAKGVCFADSGYLTGLNIYNVSKITTGKNAGYVKDSLGNYYPFSGREFCQNVTATFTPPIKNVVAIYIDPKPPC